MSIVALKRKSLTQYGSKHYNSKGQFALNGVVRQLPYNLGRTVTRTPFVGPYPVGHGQGKTCRVSGWRARATGNSYPVIVSNSGSCIIPQTEIKRSTMNNAGMIETRYKGILHASKSHVHRIDKDQNTYIKKMTCQSSDASYCASNPLTPNPLTLDNPLLTTAYIKTASKCTPYTKDTSNLTYEQYNHQLIRECVPIVSPFKGNNICSAAP
jgi:hypothetical protein